MLVVFDTSPWIFLSKLGLIEQTVGLFNKVFIPSSVGEEISVLSFWTIIQQDQKLSVADCPPSTAQPSFAVIKSFGFAVINDYK